MIVSRTGIIEVSHLISAKQAEQAQYIEFVETSLQTRLMDALWAALNDGRSYVVKVSDVWRAEGSKHLPIKLGRHAVVVLADSLDAGVGEFCESAESISGRTYKQVNLVDTSLVIWQRVQ